MVLVLGRTSTGPGDRSAIDDRLPTSNVMFRCEDVPATYRDLSGRGVDFPQPPVELNFGWWCLFSDTEGNRFALQPADHDRRPRRSSHVRPRSMTRGRLLLALALVALVPVVAASGWLAMASVMYSPQYVARVYHGRSPMWATT